jgi:outer membrane protein assembly factor BamB
MYGPAGGAIWSAPTIDAKRGQLYVATGDSYTEIDHPTSDAVLAMDLKTGKIRWANQVLADDNFMSVPSGQVNSPLGVRGPDYDFGSSPQLIKVGSKDLVVTGNKSSIVYAMDPDTGKTVWATPGSGGRRRGGMVDGDGRASGLRAAGGPGRSREQARAGGAGRGDGRSVAVAAGLTLQRAVSQCRPGYCSGHRDPGAVFLAPGQPAGHAAPTGR